MDLAKAFKKTGIKPIGKPVIIKIKPGRVGYVWTFCYSCKKIQHTKVGYLYYEYHITPYHRHGTGQHHLAVFPSKIAALQFKKIYKEPRFGD